MHFLLALIAIAVASSVAAQTQSADVVWPAAMRLPGGSRIQLDGRISEPAWSAASPITELRQHDPAVGEPATERTEVRVLFDSTALYVSVQAFDSRPDEVIARILARDRVMVLEEFTGLLNFASDDGVAILIDPFRDRRNAVVFATNPNGAEFDAQITDQGREVNVAWRTVWRVAAARTDSGWSAEFEIPLRSIRHPTDGRPWGLNVYRVIRRKNEHVMWRSWSRDNAGFLKVSEAGDLEGLSGFAREGIGAEVKMSAIGRDVRGDVSGRTRPADGALDIKYELRPGVTMDVTANTDFAQADVDDVQINLTRFSLFFPEKRDFFLENAGVFEFGARGVFEPPPWLMFFSRRIGISDSGEIPVLGGVRLTGREGAQTFGLLHMQTDATPYDPRAAYSVARFKRDVGTGGFLGAMYSAVAESRQPRAESYGADFQYWPTATVNVQGFVAQVRGGEATGASSRDRAVARLVANREVDRWGLRLDHFNVGASADPPLGFATRTDIQRTDAMIRLTFRPSIPGVRRLEILNFNTYVARTDGALQDWHSGPGVRFTFNSGDNVTLVGLRAHTVLDDSFDVADRLTVAPGSFPNAQSGLFVSTAERRPVSLNGSAGYQQFYGGTLLALDATLNIALGARGTIGLTRAFNEVSMPAGDLVTNISAVRMGYAFSTRSTVSTTVQYDALDHVMTANARFGYMYRPGSELFIVLNEERERAIPRALQPRTALLKLTYLARL